MLFVLTFILVLRPRGTHLVPRHCDSRRGTSMALAFSSIPLAPTKLEDATTRPSRPQLNFAWPRATRSATTFLGPEQLARPRLYLAPTSSSLGHEQLARPCHLFSRPRACSSLRHREAIARPQQLARPRAQSTTVQIYLSGLRATRSVSDFFSCKLTPTPQRYRKFGRELPATSKSTLVRSPLVIAGSASITSSPHTWPTCRGQACRPCCLHCRYRPFEHSVSVFLSSSPSLSLFESSLTIRLGFSRFQSHILYDRFLNFRLFVSISHVLRIHLHAPSLHLTFIFVLSTGFLLFLKRGYCSDSHARFTCTHYNTHALAHYTLTVFTTFVLSIFILILSYTHSLLSPCFSFWLSFSFFGLVAHT